MMLTVLGNIVHRFLSILDDFASLKDHPHKGFCSCARNSCFGGQFRFRSQSDPVSLADPLVDVSVVPVPSA